MPHAQRPDFQRHRSTRHAACRDRQPDVRAAATSPASNRSASGLCIGESEIGPPMGDDRRASSRTTGTAARRVRSGRRSTCRSASRRQWNQLFVLVRGDGAPAAMLPSVREAVRALDPEQPIYAIQSLEEAIAQSSFQQRIAALLLSIFAGVALVMAAVGIFGVMSYSVSARTQEMGVRLAVGAQRRDVVWLVVGHVLQLAGIGPGDRRRAVARRPAGDRRPPVRCRGRRRGMTIAPVPAVLGAWSRWSPRGFRPLVPAGSIPSRRCGTSKARLAVLRSLRLYAARFGSRP